MMRNGQSKHHLGQREQNKDGGRELQVNCKEGFQSLKHVERMWHG